MLERVDVEAHGSPAFEQFAAHHRRLYSWAAGVLAKEGGCNLRIVDAACGVGFGYGYVTRFGNYVGLDLCAKTIGRARKRWPRASYRVCNLEELDVFYTVAPIDVVLSFETAEHLRNPDAFLRRVRTSLRPGGLLLFSAPTCLSRDYDPYHRHDRTAPQWRASLLNAGFDVESEGISAFSVPFREFLGTTPTTWLQKVRIGVFILLHPWYWWDRFLNWGVRRRFSWSSSYFACRACGNFRILPARCGARSAPA